VLAESSRSYTHTDGFARPAERAGLHGTLETGRSDLRAVCEAPAPARVGNKTLASMPYRTERIAAAKAAVRQKVAVAVCSRYLPSCRCVESKVEERRRAKVERRNPSQ
jgi:hypothetical protein